MDKKKILFVGEASFVNTGFSVYGKELLTRLHESGKYDIAELACYGTPDDPRRHELPWKYYWNQPAKADWEKVGYIADSVHQFGAFRFNDVVLDYQPDIVCDFRDHWMLEHEEQSPFRRLFHWVIMPTVDATPQAEAWLSTYMTADAVLTYTDWSRGILDREGGGLIKTRGSAPPAADTTVFRPLDRESVRSTFNFEDDVLIIGTVMRNQARKLYPQLIKDFAEFIRVAPPEIARRAYLYMHASYPDREGWNIPYFIKESGISHKILVTYRCLRCHTVFASFFQDARASCVKCGSTTATMPNSSNGVDRNSLAHIINLFDLYVQYSNSEGFGLPQVEAASCGVPVMATDYSAMSDVVRKLEGYPIPVASLEVEPQTNCLRARPDGKAFVRMLIDYFGLSDEERREKRTEVHEAALYWYDWDKTTKKWQEVFDSLLPLSSDRWRQPPRIHEPISLTRDIESNEAFVEYCIRDVLGRPELLNSYMSIRLARDLNWGSSTRGNTDDYKRLRPFSREDALKEMVAICDHYNEWELKRYGSC